MEKVFLDTKNLPFCRGCGHHIVASNIEKALNTFEELNPLDVIIVTDIGCIGIIDKKFNTHTVHGLHGRSAALATGIALGLSEPSKKIIVLLGDGGATIGLQHLIEAASKNVNMTIIVHNNMLYGMTGGQPSGLTPCGYKTPILPEGKPNQGYDLRGLIYAAGATYSRRLIATGDFSQELAQAFSISGLSFVEAIELCTSYGAKFNPGRNLQDIVKESGLEIGLLSREEKPLPFEVKRKSELPSLFQSQRPIRQKFQSSLRSTYALYISGSAGEGAQSAAEFLAQAAMLCGLSVTKKGSYPVTVGVGFSTAELIMSPKNINFTGIENPEAVIANSKEGLEKVRPIVEKMCCGKLFIDKSLQVPTTGARIIPHDYRGALGARNASLLSVMHFIKDENIIPMEAFLEIVRNSKVGAKLDLDKMLASI